MFKDGGVAIARFNRIVFLIKQNSTGASRFLSCRGRKTRERKKRKPCRERKIPTSASPPHLPTSAPDRQRRSPSLLRRRRHYDAMRRFAADRARRAVAASLRATSSYRSAAPSPLAPAPRYPAPSVGAAAMAVALARTMSTAAAGTPPVSLNTINPKVPLLPPHIRFV